MVERLSFISMKMKIRDVVVDLMVYFVGSSGELSSVIGQKPKQAICPLSLDNSLPHDAKPPVQLFPRIMW